jgi:hypothetical protein
MLTSAMPITFLPSTDLDRSRLCPQPFTVFGWEDMPGSQEVMIQPLSATIDRRTS